MIHRFNLQSQSVYSELVESLRVAEAERLFESEGSLTRREVKGNAYWYLRRRVGSRIRERYLGPETDELLERLQTLRVEAADAKQASRHRRNLIRMLRSAGYLMTDRRSGRILEELSISGVFRLNGVLVGTYAFRCYSAVLGLRFDSELASTSDLDLAHDPRASEGSVSVAIESSASPSLGEALGRAERFVRVPDLDPRSPPTSWRTADRQLRVDVVTPLVGRAREGPVELPTLGTHATALRFMDFLLAETLPAAVLTGSGVLVRVPTPERFALHKLIVSQRRGLEGRDRAQKDLAQARVLLTVLLEEQPENVRDCWLELGARGKRWATEAQRAGRKLPRDLWQGFLDAVAS